MEQESRNRKNIPELSFEDADRILRNVMESCGLKPVPLQTAMDKLRMDLKTIENSKNI